MSVLFAKYNHFIEVLADNPFKYKMDIGQVHTDQYEWDNPSGLIQMV